jgi:hypothetical protein
VEAPTTSQATKEATKQQQKDRGVGNWYLKNNGGDIITTNAKITNIRNKQ